MKILTRLFAVMFLITAFHCASVAPNSVKMAGRWDESAARPIKSVYIKVNDVGNSEEDMYVAVIKGFKKDLLQKEVTVVEFFTGDIPSTSPDSSKVDAVLVLGKPFQDIWRGPDTPVPGVGGVGIMHSNTKRQRFTIQLLDPVTKNEIWVGEVSFVRPDAIHVGNKAVRQWVAAGLVAQVKPD